MPGDEGNLETRGVWLQIKRDEYLKKCYILIVLLLLIWPFFFCLSPIDWLKFKRSSPFFFLLDDRSEGSKGKPTLVLNRRGAWHTELGAVGRLSALNSMGKLFLRCLFDLLIDFKYVRCLRVSLHIEKRLTTTRDQVLPGEWKAGGGPRDGNSLEIVEIVSICSQMKVAQNKISLLASFWMNCQLFADVLSSAQVHRIVAAAAHPTLSKRYFRIFTINLFLGSLEIREALFFLVRLPIGVCLAIITRWAFEKEN